MKKALALFLSALLVLSFAACGKHEHAFGDWVVKTEATCTKEGLRERSCECGEVETEVIPATGHSFSAATIFAPMTCTVCGKTKGKPLGTQIEIGKEYTAKEHKFTVSDVYFTNKISEKRGSITRSFGDGHYLVVQLAFTNLSNSEMDDYTDRVTDIELKYDNTYDYEGDFQILQNEIVPLDTQNAYVMYVVPDALETEDGKSIVASFKVDDILYVLFYRGTPGAQTGTEPASSSAEEPTTTTAANAASDKPLSIGETRSDGKSFSFTLDKVYFANKVSEKRGSITRSTGDGHYLVLQLAFTNLTSSEMDDRTDRVTDLQLKYDDAYDYEGDFEILQNEIVPLDTQNAYIMFKVPETLDSADGSLIATFKIDGSAFKVDCRSLLS